MCDAACRYEFYANGNNLHIGVVANVTSTSPYEMDFLTLTNDDVGGFGSPAAIASSMYRLSLELTVRWYNTLFTSVNATQRAQCGLATMILVYGNALIESVRD
jgi:hypothetical protein